MCETHPLCVWRGMRQYVCIPYRRSSELMRIVLTATSHDGLRSRRVSRYVVFYRLSEKAIDVVRVLDERQDVDMLFSEGE
jgi:hypothetical protein